MAALDLRDTTVLMPAAGPVPEGILALSNIATPAMIPVAGAPVIHWNLTYLTSLGARDFRIAVPQRGLSIEDYAECVFGKAATFTWVVPSVDRGVGFTVLELLEGVEGPALVVLGDTLFEFGAQSPPADEPWILTSEVDESDRWCVVEAGNAGEITTWHDKVPGLPRPMHAAIGVYCFPDAGSARANAAHLLGGDKKIEMSSVVRAAAGNGVVHARPAGLWRDCGNPDTQEASRRQILQERAFNSLRFDDRRGTIRKASANREKLIDEINFMRLLPNDVAALFPRIVDASTKWDDPWVELEYYGYPTLTELFLFERLRPATWRRIFDRLNDVLSMFAEHARPIGTDALVQMYTGKARDRLRECKERGNLGELLVADSIEVNGTVLPNVPDLVTAAEQHVLEQASGARGSIIHGDLCFSNILFDVRTGVCKLIDPRGSFGQVGVHGDQRYDVAKLHHSVIGGYDQIVAGLLDFELSGTSVTLDIHTTAHQLAVQAEYRQQVLSNWAEAEIELITGLMFAGLPALHYESPRRQAALYVRGAELLARSLGVTQA